MTDEPAYPPTDIVEISAGGGRWSESVQAFREYNYRLFATGQLFSTTAVWMQRIAQDWLVLELTGSVTAVGFMVVMQFGPILALGMFGGVIVDRYPKRLLIICTQTTVALIGAALATLTLLGLVQAWHVFALAGLLGLVSVIDQPARQVFVSELVTQSALRNAISSNSAIFQVGGMLGPAVSGVLIVSAGSGWAFASTVAACLVSLGMLIAIRPSRLYALPTVRRSKGQVREALRYARRKPAIFWTLLLLVFVASLGLNWPVLLAAMAHGVYHSGAAGYGLYNSALAAGSLAGALLSMHRRSVRLRAVVIAVGGFAALKLLSGLSPLEVLFIAAIAAAGLVSILMWTAANALLQLSSNRGIRGRIMALYLLITVGGQAIGGPVLGWVCDVAGARAGMVASSAVPLAAAIAIALIVARHGGLRLRAGFGAGGLPIRIVREKG